MKFHQQTNKFEFVLIIFSRELRDSSTRFVGPSVGPSVCPSIRPSIRHTLLFFVLFFFAAFGLTAPAQMIRQPKIQPLPTRTQLG